MYVMYRTIEHITYIVYYHLYMYIYYIYPHAGDKVSDSRKMDRWTCAEIGRPICVQNMHELLSALTWRSG